MRIHAMLAVPMIACALVFSACNSKELTREKAKEIIENSELYQLGKHPIALQADDVSDLVYGEKYLAWKDSGGFNWDLVVTGAGSQYFEGAQGRLFGVGGLRGTLVIPESVTLATPIRPKVVLITGITAADNGGDSVKRVEYNWQWDDSTQPKELRTILRSLHTINKETATLRLYDNGWRAEWSEAKKVKPLF